MTLLNGGLLVILFLVLISKRESSSLFSMLNTIIVVVTRPYHRGLNFDSKLYLTNWVNIAAIGAGQGWCTSLHILKPCHHLQGSRLEHGGILTTCPEECSLINPQSSTTSIHGLRESVLDWHLIRSLPQGNNVNTSINASHNVQSVFQQHFPNLWLPTPRNIKVVGA